MLPNDLIGGMIGAEHYNQWRANFGLTANGGPASGNSDSRNAAVPEPASVVMLILAVAEVCLRRGRAA